MKVIPFAGEGINLFQSRSSDAAPPNPTAFVLCPCSFRPGPDQAWGYAGIYQLAYQQAVAALLPPWHERHFLASMN